MEMVVFNVPRAGRYESSYTRKLIHNMFHANYVLFRMGFGICCDDVEEIVNSFAAMHCVYSKINLIKTHYFEIFIDYDIQKETVFKVAQMVGRMIYDNGFQNFVTVVDTGDNYLIAVALNAVSYQTGTLFHDNNACYFGIFNFIKGLFSKSIEVSFTENTFFDPDKREGNYCHGAYI
jgi:hypothetical protein